MKFTSFILYLVFATALIALMMFGTFLSRSSEQDHDNAYFRTSLIQKYPLPKYISELGNQTLKLLLHEDDMNSSSLFVSAPVTVSEVTVTISSTTVPQKLSAGGNEKHKLLCVSFLNTTIEAVLFLFANINIMKDDCDWAIVVFATGMMSQEDLCATESIAPFTVYCNRSFMVQEDLFVPLGALFPEIAFLLPDYDRVFLMDQGVSLLGFDPDTFFRLARCSFAGGYPMVSHPLLREPSWSKFPYLLRRHWNRSSNGTDSAGPIVATEVLLVEPVAAMVDSRFLMWLVRHLLATEAPKWLGQGFDWVLPRMLCGAAEAFIVEEFNLTVELYKSPKVGCVLITGGEPVRFLQRRSG